MTNICHCDTVILLGEIFLWCFALCQSFTLISTFTSFHITKVYHLGPSHHFCLIYFYSFLYLTRVSSFTLALSPLGFHRLLAEGVKIQQNSAVFSRVCKNSAEFNRVQWNSAEYNKSQQNSAFSQTKPRSYIIITVFRFDFWTWTSRRESGIIITSH